MDLPSPKGYIYSSVVVSAVLQDLFDIPGGPLLIQPGDAIVSILV